MSKNKNVMDCPDVSNAGNICCIEGVYYSIGCTNTASGITNSCTVNISKKCCPRGITKSVVEDRLDILSVVEKWIYSHTDSALLPSTDEYERGMYVDTDVVRVYELERFIDELRDNPQSVIAKGKKGGWL